MEGLIPLKKAQGRLVWRYGLKALLVAFLFLVTAVFSLPESQAKAATSVAAVGSGAAGQDQGGELLVGFKHNATNAEEGATVERSGGKIVERLDSTDAAVVRTSGGADVDKLEQRLERSSRVLYVEPNFRVKLLNTPNDPYFSSLWGLNNTGQSGGLTDVDIDAPEAWSQITGTGNIVVAVIDTGIDYQHTDLADNIWTNSGEVPGNLMDDDSNGLVDDIHGYDFFNGDGNPDDDNEHGTHVAGTIGAEGNNGIGTVGVAWDTKLMALKFLSQDGWGFLSDAIQSIDYAVDNGAKVINASWGGGGYSQAMYDAIKSAGDNGVLFVAAAGNSGVDADQNPMYPAAYNLDNIVSVAADTRNDALAYFSNYGATSVDLAAPGYEILSTTPDNTYQSFSGTSMASPHVAGAAALYLAAKPPTAPTNVRVALIRTADLGAAYEGKTVSGGRLNAVRLLNGDVNRAAEPEPPSTLPAEEPPEDDQPTSKQKRFRLLKPKPNSQIEVKGKRNRARVPFSWNRIENVEEYRLYLKSKRLKKGKCLGDKRNKRSKPKRRACYRLVKTLRDPDGAEPRLAKSKTTLRLKVGKYRYLVVAIKSNGAVKRARSRSKEGGKRHASVGFKVISSKANRES